MFPNPVMSRGHSPSSYVDELQDEIVIPCQAGDTTDDGEIGPMMIQIGKGLMVSDDDPVPPAFRITGTGRELWPVILIERAIFHVQPKISISGFLFHDDGP
jgi:hypothetical protein